MNLSPLEEQPVLLTSESSLQPPGSWLQALSAACGAAWKAVGLYGGVCLEKLVVYSLPWILFSVLHAAML